MHDPKFEKEVQQKMEELEFSPSEAVWANLQGELFKHKRRRAPLLWLFFLVGGMLLGASGAGLYFYHTRTSGEPRPENDIPATGNSIQANNIPANSSTANNVPANSITANNAPANRNPTGSIAGKDGTVNGKTSDKRMAKNGSVRSENNPAIKDQGSREPMDELTQVEPGFPGMVAVTAPLAPVRPYFTGDPAVGLDRIGPAAAQNKTDDLRTATNKRALKSARLKREPGWQAGFTGGAGSSSLYMSQMTSLAPVASLSLSSGVYPLSSAFRPGAQQQVRVAKATPDLSFRAGIFVQKPVFKKLSLTAGLNLHYYSTRVETGQKNAAQATPSASLFSNSPYVQPAAQLPPYYVPGNDYEYTNQYYFLEIPVSLQWQVNHSRKRPLFWEGGLSLSRLISTNALYFNEKSGVYFKDAQVINPTHVMAFTSLMIGLSWRGNLIQLGPEGQYELTSLLNASGASSQHLFYGGIKLMIIPRKW